MIIATSRETDNTLSSLTACSDLVARVGWNLVFHNSGRATCFCYYSNNESAGQLSLTK